MSQIAVGIVSIALIAGMGWRLCASIAVVLDSSYELGAGMRRLRDEQGTIGMMTSADDAISLSYERIDI